MENEITMDPTDTILAASAGSVDSVQDVMDKFLDTARVETVYGKPVKHGSALIIPTAEVLAGMGFGMGFGGGSGSASGEGKDEAEAAGEEEPADEGEEKSGGASSGTGGGGGGGGGGRILARPVAVIIADEDGVRVEPVFDRTKVALAALTAFGFIFGMMARMRRATRNFD